MKVYALGIRGPIGELTLAGEPALNTSWEVVEQVRLKVQALDDAIADAFPQQQPREFVVLALEGDPTVAVADAVVTAEMPVVG